MAYSDAIVTTIRQLCTPLCIILYGEKRTLSTDKLKAASLCIVIPDDTDKHALQHTLYLSIIADIPINLTLYTIQEWNTLTQDETSYAAWIRRKGRLLYEQGS